MKLTLRDLFWLTVVVAMGLGWWVERSKLIDRVQTKRKMTAPRLTSATSSGSPWSWQWDARGGWIGGNLLQNPERVVGGGTRLNN